MADADSEATNLAGWDACQPSDLVAHLCQYASVLAPFTGLDPAPPTPGAASEFETVIGAFLDVAFQASLRSNEGRRVRCRLLLTPSPNDATVRFPSHPPYTAENAAKLAPITGLGGTRIIVLPANDRLTIIGFGDLQRGQAQSVLDPMRSHMPDVVGATLSILDPGHLRIGIGSYIVEFVRGQIHEVESLRNVPQVEEWLMSAAAAICPGQDADIAFPVVARTWASILANVGDLRHGGTFVVQPKSHGVAENYLHIRNALNSDLIAAALRRRIEVEPKIRSQSQVVDGASLQSLQEAPVLVRNLSNAAGLLAGFAAVDGAVVLSHALQIVGFGAEITAKGEFNEAIHEYRSGESMARVSLEHVGMRHRSAAYLARAVPGALIFVVSQDGGVSVFTMGQSHIERYLVAATERME